MRPRAKVSRVRANVSRLAAGVIAAGLTACAASPSSTGDAGDDDAVASIRAFIAEAGVDTTSDGWRRRLPRPPVVSFASGRTYVWNVTTNRGPLRIVLLPDVAPAHVSNVIYLTELGFYDGNRSHRAVKDFMVQAGCPLENGTGNPGFRLDLETRSGVGFDRVGVLAAANAGPNTDGSQFFLTLAPTAWLNGAYTVYGHVDGTDSMRTLHAMEQVSNTRDGPPVAPIVFEEFAVAVE